LEITFSKLAENAPYPNEKWNSMHMNQLSLEPIPIDLQPNQYIKTTYAKKKYGLVTEVKFCPASCKDNLYFYLEWYDSKVPNTEFQDMAAVYFPLGPGNEEAINLGTRKEPVLLLQWRHRTEMSKNLSNIVQFISYGPGVFIKEDADPALRAEAELADGKWKLVISIGRKQLPESFSKLGVVVWDGSNQERAGLAAATKEWIVLKG